MTNPGIIFVIGVLAGLCGCTTSLPFDDVMIEGEATAHMVSAVASPIGVFYRTSSVPIHQSEAHDTPDERPATAVRDGADVSELANALTTDLTRVTADIWPRAFVPVDLDLIVRAPPTDAFHSRWRLKTAREPWRLRFAIDEREASPSLLRMLAHELYHLLAEQWQVHDTSRQLPRESLQILEEVSAFLYGQCALIIVGEAARVEKMPGFAMDITNTGESIEAPFDDTWLARIVQALETGHTPAGDRLPYAIHLGLNLTAFAQISGGERIIEPSSPAAETLIERCRQFAPDPGEALAWFGTIASDGHNARLEPHM